MPFNDKQTLKFKTQLTKLFTSIFCYVSQNNDVSQRTSKNRNTQNILISYNHNPAMWPFECNEVNACFLRGLLSLLTAAKTQPLSEQSSLVIERHTQLNYYFYLIQVTCHQGLVRTSPGAKTKVCINLLMGCPLLESSPDTWNRRSQTKIFIKTIPLILLHRKAEIIN